MSLTGKKGLTKSASKPTQPSKSNLPPKASAQTSKIHLIWVHSKSPLFNPLFRVVLQEICSFIANSPFLIFVSSTKTLHVFDIETKQWRKCRLGTAINSSDESRCVQIDSERFFYCGGIMNPKFPHTVLAKCQPSSRTAYLIARTGEVTVLPDMRSTRANHGIIAVSGEVFVFGGTQYCFPNSMAVRSCEVFSLAERKWENLPLLQVARRMFNPVLWLREIYLCGGAEGGVIEVCSPGARTLRVLKSPVLKPDFALSYAHNDELVVVQETSFAVLSSSAVIARVEERPYEQEQWRSSSVVVQGKVYAIRAAICVELSANTGREVEMYAISKKR